MMTVAVDNNADNESSTFARTASRSRTQSEQVWRQSVNPFTEASMPKRRDSDDLMFEAHREGIRTFYDTAEFENAD